MPAQIRPNRLEVTDRFPMLGFTIRTRGEPRRAEIAIATDPGLFGPGGRAARRPSNFYSSRAGGTLEVARGEAVYVIPPEILAQFVGSERLYFGLATTGPSGPIQFEVDVMPTSASPYVSLPDTNDAEGRLRATLRGQAVASYVHSVDPASSDYLFGTNAAQALVDSSYFTNALIRAPKQLWEPLDTRTKARIVKEIKALRSVSPPYTNWLLFAAMNEAFLLSIGEQWDPVRIDLAIRKMLEWYAGDGWYADGPHFHFDYYGSYVIHPMMVEILEVLVRTNAKFNSLKTRELLEQATKRMQRYGESLERLIGPEGSFPPIGRSLTYRTAVFQPLGLLAWRKLLPKSLPEGQVRAATLAAQRAIFSNPTNFDDKGYLTIGFAGHQPALADWYSNAGSMYLASLSLIALGLPAADSYWTSAAEPWTSKRAFAGAPFVKDYYVEY